MYLFSVLSIQCFVYLIAFFFLVQSEREDDRELPAEGLSPVAGFLLLISLGFACFLNSLSITV